jgi:hypothetical protein
MRYLQKLISREFYRSVIFWLLSLIALYTLAGFFVLPKVIHKAIVEQVEQQLGWQTDIETIAFNPYALTLVINNLKISDQQAQQQLSFKRYYMNFELRSIFEGAFTFSDIELLEPTINLELDKQGISNFQHAMRHQLEKNPALKEGQPADQTENTLAKLLFDNINIIAGNINIIDNTPAQTIKYQLNPITFNLKNLLTYGDQNSTYHLDLALGKGQTITWDGTLAITPLRSNGTLKIDGFRVHDFWRYLSEQVPFNLKHALVGMTGEYEFSMAKGPIQLNIHQGAIQVDDIKLATKQSDHSFADIDALNIGSFDFNLADKKLHIKALQIDAINLRIERNKEGLIDLLSILPEANTPSPPEATSNTESVTAESPWQWSISDITLNNSQVNFIDKQPTTSTEIVINKINFAIQGVSHNLSKSLPFNLTYYINQEGETKLNGQVTALPLDVQAHLTLKEFALPALQPYIDDLAKVNLEQGKLSISGDINLRTNKQDQMQGNFQGAFNIDHFNTKDKVLEQRLVGWQSLTIDPININFNPLSITINKVALTEPYVRLIITEDRSVNLAKLVINNQGSEKMTASNKQKRTEIETEQQKSKQPAVAVKVDKITIKGGDAYFADLSLQPQFATSIQKINGEINGLSSEDLTRADVNIRGSIEEYGKMLVKGKINPLSGDLYTDINVNFDKIELAHLTPYSGRHVGYEIDKGKLSLDLNYQIANNRLIAKNHLTLDQFELGQQVNSSEALNLPLKLAIALLTDKNGIIDIQLPITGDMDDPDFAISGLVIKAFVNLLTKAVTSPFSLIANLIGGDPGELNSLAFELGSTKLTAANIEQLNSLASILNSRPNLILEVRAMVDEKQDGLALKRQKMRTLLIKSAIDNNVEQEQRIAAIEKLLGEYGGKQELNKLQSKMRTEITAVEEDSEKLSKQQLITDGYEQFIREMLLVKQPLSNLELIDLAQQRINIIKAQLFEQGKVANKQVFTLQPSLQGHAQESTISTIFTLTSN